MTIHPRELEEFLSPQPVLDSLNTHLTSRCNLRCLYCPQGKGITDDRTDMPPDLLEHLIQYVASHKVPAVGFGYFGETTLYAGWENSCQRLLEIGTALSLTANFAAPLTTRALDVLSRFRYIEMSIDSVDGGLLRMLRPPIDVRTILYNLHAIRARAMASGGASPFICWPCVLTDRSARELSDLVLFAASCGVDRLQINEMYRFDGTPDEIRNILELPDAEFLAAFDRLEQAVALGRQHALPVSVSGIEKYRARAEAIRMPTTGTAETPRLRRGRIQGIQGPADHYYLGPGISPGQTRLCLYPWSTAYVAATGDVYACCARGTVMGNIQREGGLDSVLVNTRYRELRRQLLTGEIRDPVCRICSMAPAAPIVNQVERVRQRLGRESWTQRLGRHLRKRRMSRATGAGDAAR